MPAGDLRIGHFFGFSFVAVEYLAFSVGSLALADIFARDLVTIELATLINSLDFGLRTIFQLGSS